MGDTTLIVRGVSRENGLAYDILLAWTKKRENKIRTHFPVLWQMQPWWACHGEPNAWYHIPGEEAKRRHVWVSLWPLFNVASLQAHAIGQVTPVPPLATWVLSQYSKGDSNSSFRPILDPFQDIGRCLCLPLLAGLSRSK